MHRFVPSALSFLNHFATVQTVSTLAIGAGMYANWAEAMLLRPQVREELSKATLPGLHRCNLQSTDLCVRSFAQSRPLPSWSDALCEAKKQHSLSPLWACAQQYVDAYPEPVQTIRHALGISVLVALALPARMRGLAMISSLVFYAPSPWKAAALWQQRDVIKKEANGGPSAGEASEGGVEFHHETVSLWTCHHMGEVASPSPTTPTDSEQTPPPGVRDMLFAVAFTWGAVLGWIRP